MDPAHRDPAHNAADHQLDGPAQSSLNPDHTSAMETGVTGSSNGDAVESNGNMQVLDAHLPVKERADPYVEQVQNVVTSDVGHSHLIPRVTAG